jgi:hypothetical protein
MRELQKTSPNAIQPWPTAIKEVDEKTYDIIQNLVRASIERNWSNLLTPSEWEDIHWSKANE